MLCTSCSVSKADIITVPLINGLSVTVGTGTNALPLQNLNTAAGATNVTMNDDSNVNVPLGFAFPYFGKTFTDSWMYSNGAVSFTGPSAPGGFCCSGANLTTLRDPGYNYSIVPLWTDLIAIQGGTHYTLGTPTSMTYGWYGVSEYADPSKRNTFEVKIDNTGLVDVRFAGAFVAFHPVTSGFIGDIEKGEYYQHHYGNGFQTGPVSYSLGGKFAVEDPCLKDPLSSPSCPGYATALLKSLPTPTTPETTTAVAEPTSTAPTQSTAVLAAPTAVEVIAPTQTTATTSSTPATTTAAPTATATVATTTSSPSVSNPQPKVGEVASSSAPKISLSMIMSIVGAEQTRISGVEKSVVQESVSMAVSAGQQAVAVAESTASSAVSNSASAQTQGVLGSSVMGTSSAQSTTTSVVGGFNQAGTTGQNDHAFRLQSNQTSAQSSEQPSSNASTGIKLAVFTPPPAYVPPAYVPPTTYTLPPKPITEVESVKSEGFKLGGQSALDMLIEKPAVSTQQPTSTGNETVKKTVADNEAAAGMTIASIATQPTGYDAYFSVLKDAVFYAPKEVYQNQRVIDNQRVLRQLSNDRLHQQLTEQQYKGN